MNKYYNQLGISPVDRCKKLRKLINSKKIVRVIEAHNGLSGLIAENISYEDEEGIRNLMQCGLVV